MKIVEFINTLASGGAEKFVVDLCNELTELGHEVHLITLSESEVRYTFNKQFLDKKVNYHSLNVSTHFRFSTILKLERLICDIEPDVVNSHLNFIYFCKLALTKKNIRFYYTLHNLAPVCIGKEPFRLIAKYLFSKGAVHPITISEECAKSYTEYFDLAKPVVITNGRSKGTLSKRYNEVISEILSYKKNCNTKVFIHVARCHPQKNQELLIKSFNQIIIDNHNAILLIIGNKFDSEIGIRLKHKACEYIHFLGEKNNVSDYLACSDYFCLSSTYEGLPISLLEALSWGVTPVCTPVGGIVDVIKDGISGYLSQDLSVSAYTNALEKAINTPLDKDSLISVYNEAYSMSICAKKYIAAYNSKYENLQ